MYSDGNSSLFRYVLSLGTTMVFHKTNLKKSRHPLKHKSTRLLRKKLWDIFSRYIRLKEGGVCFTCGVKRSIKKMYAGHFVHKDCLDFDERNIHVQCRACNLFRRGNLTIYAEKLEAKYGYGIIQELNRLGDQTRQFKVKELEEMIKVYKNKL